MKKLVFLLPLCLAFGCTTRVVLGFDDGGSSTSAGSASGAAASSTGTGTGSGSVAGTTSSSVAGQTTASGSTGGTSAGNTTAGTTGTTGGTTTGCVPDDVECGSSSACCSGSCDEVCTQGFGQECLTGLDCTSGTCTDHVCGCAVQTAQLDANCGTDSDCCNDVACHLSSYQGLQYGTCCNVTGGTCRDAYDCCDFNCVNGQCLCMAVGGQRCQSDADCCTGKCIVGELFNTCFNTPGDPCNKPSDCTTQNCPDQVCGTCASYQGLCDSSTDCCSGLVCAENLTLAGVDFGVPAMDAGLACCGPTGASCNADAGYGGSLECCSGLCDTGACSCANPTDQCVNDQSCCTGACLTRASSGQGPLACCQVNDQFCISDVECCSGNCHNDSCACVPDGGACGAPGGYASLGPAACCSGVCGDGGECL